MRKMSAERKVSETFLCVIPSLGTGLITLIRYLYVVYTFIRCIYSSSTFYGAYKEATALYGPRMPFHRSI